MSERADLAKWRQRNELRQGSRTSRIPARDAQDEATLEALRKHYDVDDMEEALDETWQDE